jgi:ribose/xylose/arabinose/galactoside ABC-type transport system permease subunit
VSIAGTKVHILKAGSVIITAQQNNGTAAPATQALAVLPASLTITANNAAMFQGAATPTLTASYSGFVNGDNSASLTIQPIITTSATAASATGAYPIIVNGAAGPNYIINHVDGTLTVDFTLPPTNFKLAATSATCRGTSDGIDKYYRSTNAQLHGYHYQ